MDRNEILVIPAPASKCKTCKKNERRDGSSYCQVCADLFKQYGFMVYDADIDFTREQLLSLKEEKPFTVETIKCFTLKPISE